MSAFQRGGVVSFLPATEGLQAAGSRATMKELRQYRRAKSFLRGLIYDCRKRGAMGCMIRDLSEDGARIVLSDTVALPEVIELDIPQRELRRRARVVWRRNGEIGLCFASRTARPTSPR
jgi:hypothetical protein